jgi:uncharacterized protein (UPF0335 family)
MNRKEELELDIKHIRERIKEITLQKRGLSNDIENLRIGLRVQKKNLVSIKESNNQNI